MKLDMTVGTGGGTSVTLLPPTEPETEEHAGEENNSISFWQDHRFRNRDGHKG